MKIQLQASVLAALIGFAASDVLAQQHKSTLGLASTVQAEWRTPIPRAEIHGELNGGELFAVEMLNHNIGWALGGSSSTHTVLFRTADGGESWERQTLFDGEGTRLRDIGFADANNGWIVGDQHVLRTTDGGETWVPVSTQKATGSGYDVAASELLVLGPDAIVMGTNAQNRQIMRTVDGGGTWELIGLVKDGGGGAGSENTVTGLALAGTSSIFATTGMHYTGVIYRSDDGGRSWERVVEADKPLHGIAFRGKRGVAVGEGISFFTEDGGDSWQRTAMPGRRYAVDFTDANTVLAVGRDPSVVISGNGGKTWQKASGPIIESGSLIAIAAVDPGWVFMASTHALHHFVDPSHTEPIAEGTLAIPGSMKLPGGKTLPSGMYRASIAHRGDRHILGLRRTGEAPMADGAGAEGGVNEEGEEEGSNEEGEEEGSNEEGEESESNAADDEPEPDCDPCEAELPVEVEYGLEELNGETGEGARPGIRLSLEPTETGLAIVLDAAAKPTGDMAAALAALGASGSGEQEMTTNVSTAGAGEKVRSAGGFLGRLKKAADGDLRGASAGAAIDPKAATERVQAAKANPPAVYRIKVRHNLDLMSGGEM